MELYVLNFLSGTVRVRVMGTNYDRFFNLCAHHELNLWDLLPAQNGYEVCMRKSDFLKLKAIIRKSHVKVQIIEKRGLPFFVRRYRKRKGILLGFLAAWFVLFWFSSHIWNISVAGNVSQTDDVIFAYLEQAGISHGMRKSEVNCKELAASVRAYFTQFSWVAVKLQGTHLIISVKEGILPEKAEENTMQCSSLAAEKSGLLQSIYVRKGLPVVKAGENVEEGEILVSGALPIYNDSLEIASYQLVNADADLIIQSEMPYFDKVNIQTEERFFTGREKNWYQFQVGTMLLKLPGMGRVSYEQYSVLQEMQQLKLSENFYLPIIMQKFTAKEYEKKEIIYTKEEAASLLKTNLQYFMKNLEEKGVQIFENDVKIEWTEKSAIAAGTLTVGENAVVRVAADQPEEELQENEYG